MEHEGMIPLGYACSAFLTTSSHSTAECPELFEQSQLSHDGWFGSGISEASRDYV